MAVFLLAQPSPQNQRKINLRVLVRLTLGRHSQPSAAIFDGRTVQSTPESGGRAGYDGYQKKNGSKTHVAVDTLGQLLALHITPANEQERDQVGVLAAAVQEVTGENVPLACKRNAGHLLTAWNEGPAKSEVT